MPLPALPPGPFWMVDDEPELVNATVSMLSAAVGSEQVRGSTNPLEVASWIETERPTALITDVRMPNLSGLELVTRLHERWGPVPVVVVTAFPTAQVNEDAHAGRFAYLPKPFSFRALRETLARICAQPAPSAFSGAIAVSMLGEVVQLYGLANRTGVLRVTSPQLTGEIMFERGRVVDATHGELRGIDAFNEILSWTSGGFSWSTTPPREHTITLGLSELLLEAYRIRDERAAGLEGAVSEEPEPELFAELEVEPRASHASQSNVDENLHRLQGIEGFLGAALFDIESNACLAVVAPESSDLEECARGHAELVAAKRRTISRLALDDELEDIVITLQREYHLLRVCRRQSRAFFFLTLDRSKANLAMARYLLSDIDRDLVL